MYKRQDFVKNISNKRCFVILLHMLAEHITATRGRCRLENFLLMKTVGASDTIGNGIHISQRIGEGMRIQNVYIEGFPGHGIAAMNGSTPLNWSNIHPFLNGLAGIYLYSGGGAGVWDICGLNHISGDGNGWNEASNTCLIRVQGGGQARDVIKLMNIKSETRGAQKNVVHLMETGSAHIDIDMLTHLGLGSDPVDACTRPSSVYSPMCVRNNDATS